MLYTFKEVTDRDAFDAFVRDNGGTVFQTSAWATVKTAWQPRLFMGYEGEKPVVSMLCLERDIRFLGKFWYGAEGFVGDMSALGEMIPFLRRKMREYGAFGLCADPSLPLRVNGRAVEDGENVKRMLSLGFKTANDVSVYAVQPPTEVVVPIVGKTEEELISACEKGVRHGYKGGAENGLFAETYSGSQIENHPEALDRFFTMMTEIADRVEFVHRTKDYYASILKALGDDCELRFVCYDRDAEAVKYENTLKKASDTEKEISNIPADAKGSKKAVAALKKELAALNKTLKTYEKIESELVSAGISDRKVYLGCGLTSYFGKNSVCLYGGTVNVLRNTLRPTNYLNFSRVLESKKRGCETHSMGRVTGDPYDEKNPLVGLLNYKKSYGGHVYEYVGDLTLSRGLGCKMFIFTRLFPKIRHFRSTVMRKFINRKHTST